MNNRTLLFFTGISVATAYIFWRRSVGTPPAQFPPFPTDDLYYSHLSPKELASHHLVDLNEASEAQLHTLGLEPDTVQRLLDNRPYRSKLELVSRMILSEKGYVTIKDKVGVARGDEPVKTA